MRWTAILALACALVTTVCADPGIAPQSEGRFLPVWEDEAGVHAAMTSAAGIGKPLMLAAQGGKAAIVHHPAWGVFAAWSSHEDRWRRVYLAYPGVEGDRLRVRSRQAVDRVPPVDDQMFPVLAATTQCTHPLCPRCASPDGEQGIREGALSTVLVVARALETAQRLAMQPG